MAAKKHLTVQSLLSMLADAEKSGTIVDEEVLETVSKAAEKSRFTVDVIPPRGKFKTATLAIKLPGTTREKWFGVKYVRAIIDNPEVFRKHVERAEKLSEAHAEE